MYSVAPGVYEVYDHSRNTRVHGRVEPERLTLYLGGVTVADAVLSFYEASTADEAQLFATPTLPPDGGIAVTNGHTKMTLNAPDGATRGAQVVIVHAQVGPDGKLTGAETAAASDPRLSSSALELVNGMSQSPQPMAQNQVYILVQYEASTP
jgi:hypothetical protein